MGKSRKLTPVLNAEIRDRYEVGESLRAIGLSLGLAGMTVARAVHLAGGNLPESASNNAITAKAARSCAQPRRVTSYTTTEGYRRVIIDVGHPYYDMGSIRGKRDTGNRTILEHRLVLAQKLGRALLAHETVHHKDGDRVNNHPDNLELRVGRHGKGATELHCATCRCFEGT